MAALADEVAMWNAASDWGFHFRWKDRLLVWTYEYGWSSRGGVIEFLILQLGAALSVDSQAPTTRWHELRAHVGISVGECAHILDVTVERFQAMENGKDSGDDIVEHASRVFRVTECWLKGHYVEIADETVSKLTDLADKGAPFDKDATLVAEFMATLSKCEACR